MPYAFVDELTVADIAFRAWGQSLEETFAAAVEAVMNAMVDDLSTIQPRETRTLTVEHEALDMLLFNFLQEFIYYKDAEQLLLRIQELHVAAGRPPFTLRATAVGEPIDPQRHTMRVDVKAVTLHHFSLAQTESGWEATVILDI
jgi:SHS2 domain-containing protein